MIYSTSTGEIVSDLPQKRSWFILQRRLGTIALLSFFACKSNGEPIRIRPVVVGLDRTRSLVGGHGRGRLRMYFSSSDWLLVLVLPMTLPMTLVMFTMQRQLE